MNNTFLFIDGNGVWGRAGLHTGDQILGFNAAVGPGAPGAVGRSAVGSVGPGAPAAAGPGAAGVGSGSAAPSAAEVRRVVNGLRVGDSTSLEVRHDGVSREVSIRVETYERPVCHIRQVKEPTARQASVLDGWMNYSSVSPGK